MKLYSSRVCAWVQEELSEAQGVSGSHLNQEGGYGREGSHGYSQLLGSFLSDQGEGRTGATEDMRDVTRDVATVKQPTGSIASIPVASEPIALIAAR